MEKNEKKTPDWQYYHLYRRCTGDRKCARCQADASARPHGPYVELRRTIGSGKREALYLGQIEPFGQVQIDIINENFQGDKPSKEAVLGVLAEEREEAAQVP